MAAIELHGLTKRYGDTVALDGVDMTVEAGEVFGFLGPNGAGKSTTIDLLLNYSRPTSGTATVFGHDAQAEPLAIRRRTGVLPEGYRPMEHTTGREHVAFAVEARGADDDPDALLQRVGLSEAADRLATDYSKGMKQRLALAMALAGEPDLLVLDEPSTGLDPHGVRRMREIVLAERDRGATVFFSSHVLSQVEAVADSVGIVQDGAIVAVDEIDALRRSIGGGSELAVTLDRAADDARAAVETIERVSVVDVQGPTLTVRCPDERKVDVVDAVRQDGATVRDLTTSQTSLEELFVAHTDDGAPAEVEA